jgi:hypothetical protein
VLSSMHCDHRSVAPIGPAHAQEQWRLLIGPKQAVEGSALVHPVEHG